MNDVDETLSTTQSMMSLSTVASTALSPNTSVAATAIAVGNPVGGVDIRTTLPDEWEKERSALYQQLDEKVNEKKQVYFCLNTNIKRNLSSIQPG